MDKFENTNSSYWRYTVLCLLGAISVCMLCLNVMDTFVADITWKQGSDVNIPPPINLRHTSELREVDSSRYQYRYTAPYNSSLVGQPFQVNTSVLRSIGFPLTNFIEKLDNKTVRQFVFATAVNSVYYTRLRDKLNKIQLHFPQHTVYVYDLGLKPNQSEQLKKVCNVILRNLFKRNPVLPPHVRHLQNYAFKPLVVHDVMRTNHGVLWIDASIIFRSNDLEKAYSQVSKLTYEMLMFAGTGTSTYAVTLNTTYTYLPTNTEKLKQLEMLAAGFVLYYRTRSVYMDILRWFVLCALDVNCISPPTNTRKCPFRNSRFTEYAHCHRYDQSVLNIILANALNFELDANISQDQVAGITHAPPKGDIKLKECW